MCNFLNRFMIQLRIFTHPKLRMSIAEKTPTIAIVNKEQAEQIYQLNHVPSTLVDFPGIFDNPGEYSPNFQQQFTTFSFNGKQLRSIRRAERRGAESVTEEKFAILFQMSLHIDGLEYKIWKLSLPMVVIVHGNQETQAWSTIFWDNHFTELDRVNFAMPVSVPWCLLKGALNAFFALKMKGQQGELARQMTDSNLHCLSEKLNLTGPHFMVTWQSFARDPMTGRNFTFWIWFYEAMKLLSADVRLKKSWQDGRIIGFIQKGYAEQMLLANAAGTFLVRFSDSVLGKTIFCIYCSYYITNYDYT